MGEYAGTAREISVESGCITVGVDESRSAYKTNDERRLFTLAVAEGMHIHVPRMPKTLLTV
jgi:hypothetical protein